jgi:hypothetical protein
VRPQGREDPTTVEKLEPQPVVAEPLGHVAAIDEDQLEDAPTPRTPDGQRTGVQTSHDPAPDVEEDDDSDPQS